jgi:hypothetical protein
MAAEARPGLLVATHFLRHEADWLAELETRLAAGYDGALSLALPGQVYEF